MIELSIWAVGLLIVTILLGEVSIKKGTMLSAILQTIFGVLLCISCVAMAILIAKIALFFWYLGA